MQTDYDAMRDSLETKGYAVLRGLLSPETAQSCVDQLEAMSSFHRADYPQTANKKGLSERGLSHSWYQPDGLTQNPAFWPFIFNERLLTAVRAIVHPDIRYLQHSDLHVGFSAISWHRDSVGRQYGVDQNMGQSFPGAKTATPMAESKRKEAQRFGYRANDC